MTITGEMRFGFGKNWTEFVKNDVNAARVETAINHILAFIGRPDLKGLDFLDIGCGSGINSAAALLAGARTVRSFDCDPDSIGATTIMRRRAGEPANWTVEHGDVLDLPYVESLGQWNFVYSWGVLHHTGDVWRAIENASKAVALGGLFYIALYSRDVQPEAEFWLRIKREYNEASEQKRRRMEWWYVWRYLMRRNPVFFPFVLWRMARHPSKRGMSLFADIRDWLGGWPMEFTYDADVKEFLEQRGFALANIKTGEACTEFLFRRDA